MSRNAWQRDPDWDRNMYPLPHEEREDQRKAEQRMVDADIERIEKEKERKERDA